MVRSQARSRIAERLLMGGHGRLEQLPEPALLEVRQRLARRHVAALPLHPDREELGGFGRRQVLGRHALNLWPATPVLPCPRSSASSPATSPSWWARPKASTSARSR